MWLPFYSFRLMIAIGFAAVALVLWTAWAWYRGGLRPQAIGRARRLHGAWVLFIPLPYLAMEAGWVTREVGRQPWVIHDVLTTADGTSGIASGLVGASLAVYVAVYGLLAILYAIGLFKVIRQGPGWNRRRWGTMLETLGPYLPTIWLVHMGFFLLYYAVSDGIDLGVGMIALCGRSSEERGTLMGSIRSNWHGNQTWLVILGGMLFGAFPAFYALAFSAFYIPILVMLFGMVFRGIAFEFRDHSKTPQRWERSFAWGSLATALAQGFALGGILSGAMRVEHGEYVGGPWDWLNLYSAWVTVGVLAGYIMLGANYLIMKTNGELQKRSRRTAWVASAATLVVAATVHLWTALRFPFAQLRWWTFPDVLLVAGLTFLAGAAFVAVFVALYRGRETLPSFFNALVVVFSFCALSVVYYPHMVPSLDTPPVTVHALAAAPSSLMFMLSVSAVALPIIVGYTSYEYWVYRGKTERDMAGLDESMGRHPPAGGLR